MKTLILAGGYGTRLEADLKKDKSGEFWHLIGVPKPLLPIGKHTLINHWMRDIQQIPFMDQTYVVTNGANHHLFAKWAESWPQVKLVCDGSTSNETRTGAVNCMNLGAQQFDCEDDALIIAGDTLFLEDFQLTEILQRFARFQATDPQASMLVYVSCSDQDVHKYGILETDAASRVIGFLEKPQPDQTLSRKQCPCFYFLSKHSLPLLSQFLLEKKDEELKARDATGNFIQYLYPRMPVYATEISGRFDVGGLHSYLQCHEHFLNRESATF